MELASDLLAGRTLDGGWKVLEKLEPPKSATGGNFSTGYLVESSSGKRGYLKALDWQRAARNPDPVGEVKRMTNAFDFERTVLKKCRDRRMDRVVLAVADGNITIDEAPGINVVPYLIFELADADVRTELDDGERYEVFWILETLHHIATGLKQLHTATIAHQDVKPSNVLVFSESEGRKLADLGKAAYEGHLPPHEDDPIAGDPSYAPPELLYRQIDPDRVVRRFGCDAYLLGSMAVFLFLGQGTTALLVSELDQHHWPGIWPGSYEKVLPYVRNAFGRVMCTLEGELPDRLCPKLLPLVKQLCEPDPKLRGHPKDRAGRGNQYALKRYVTRFDVLAKEAQAGYYR